MDEWWHHVYWGNSIRNWTIAFATIFIAGALLYGFKRTVISKLKQWTSKTSNSFDDMIVAGLERSVVPLIFVLIIYGTINYLEVPANIMSRIKVIAWILVMFYILRSVTATLRHYILGRIGAHTESEARKKQANGLILIFNIAVWVIGFVFLLDNLGYNIGTLIAGLGIGGIAIALAAQTILGDLFSYFVIYFDKPFEIGDFINFDDKSGVVEYIGLKTTRIRVLSGEQLICSNKDLTDSRVHNYGRMPMRRVVFKIRVVRQTPADTIKQIPLIVQNIIEQAADVRFDRGHFMDLGTSAFEFEFVYFVLQSDYNLYMNRQQEILVKIVEQFEERGIQFAYPTETVFLQQQKHSEDQDTYNRKRNSVNETVD